MIEGGFGRISVKHALNLDPESGLFGSLRSIENLVAGKKQMTALDGLAQEEGAHGEDVRKRKRRTTGPPTGPALSGARAEETAETVQNGRASTPWDWDW